MTDLTEQWKKGKLLTGWYYIKAIDRFTFPFGIAFIRGKEIITTFPHLLDDEIEQVLAPVPSYEEYIAVAKQLEIAVEMLKYYGNEDKWTDCHSNWTDCDTLSCLCDYGYKFAQEALKQIEELDK